MSIKSEYVGRLAPSPTGALHLGNVRTFMIAWLRARSVGGRIIMRMEDLDHPRDKPGAAEQVKCDLGWLGFDWDEEYVQSERRHIYREATRRLHDSGLVYPCICSRADVERAQSAPHEGEQLHYPGICRGRFATWGAAVEELGRNEDEGRPHRIPCWRFNVSAAKCGVVRFDDVFAGEFSQNVASVLGDFPLARDEDGAGYTLAATVDDAEMGVTEVVRGDDLLPATPAQIMLYRALGYDHPAFCHVPLVVGADGRRLAKRHGDTRVAMYRERGMRPEVVIGRLAATCGMGDGSPVVLGDLIPHFNLGKVPHARCQLSAIWFSA